MIDHTITDEDWEVVEQRLEDMPEELQLGILEHSYTKSELLEEVKKRSQVGIAYAEMQLGFIKWLAQQSKIME